MSSGESLYLGLLASMVVMFAITFFITLRRYNDQ
jgi:hypothetical protein